MSTDYFALCLTCEAYRHIGTRFAGSERLMSRGTRNVSDPAMGWIVDHAGEKHDVRIVTEHDTRLPADADLSPEDADPLDGANALLVARLYAIRRDMDGVPVGSPAFKAALELDGVIADLAGTPKA